MREVLNFRKTTVAKQDNFPFLSLICESKWYIESIPPN